MKFSADVSYIYLLERSENTLFWKLQKAHMVYGPRHNTDFRTIDEIIIGWISFCEIGKTFLTDVRNVCPFLGKDIHRITISSIVMESVLWRTPEIARAFFNFQKNVNSLHPTEQRMVRYLCAWVGERGSSSWKENEDSHNERHPIGTYRPIVKVLHHEGRNKQLLTDDAWLSLSYGCFLSPILREGSFATRYERNDSRRQTVAFKKVWTTAMTVELKTQHVLNSFLTYNS